MLQKEILKTLQMLTKKKRKKKEEKISKGKSLPGKNVSKKSQITQVDGNDDDPGEGSSKAEDTSKATKRPARGRPGAARGQPGKRGKAAKRTAATKALANITLQSLMVDGNLPAGDKNYNPEPEEESETDDNVDDDDDDDDEEEEEDAFETAQSKASESDPEVEARPRPLPSYNPISYLDADDDKFCWVESFEVDLNSKRKNLFVNFLISQH